MQVKVRNHEASTSKTGISFETLERLDIRVGMITAVEDIAESRILLKLTADFGDYSRSILVGMKQERDNPKKIEVAQVLFVLNLPEKKVAGQLSQGMLLDIGYSDEIVPVLAMPKKPVPNGTRAG